MTDEEWLALGQHRTWAQWWSKAWPSYLEAIGWRLLIGLSALYWIMILS